MSTVCHYPTDGSDAPWEVLQLVLPTPKWRPGGPGRNPLELRRVINGIFSVNKTGCPWRMMPTDFGHAPTIYGYFHRWRHAGVWGRVMDTLRQWERQSQGRLPAPSACCVESQRIKTATQDEDVGLDGNKKITGRTRHSLVDTLGLSVAVVVTAAHTDERQGLVTLLQRDVASGVKRLRKIGVDGGSQAQWLGDWGRSITQTHKIDLEVVEHTGKGFQVVQHRWQVERTFAWLVNDRRHSRDSERLTVSSEAMIQMSMIRLLLKRLAGILKQLLRLENKESLWHGDITICGEPNVTRLNHLIPKLSKEILPARSSSVVTRHADLLESSQELYGNKFGSGHGEEI